VTGRLPEKPQLFRRLHSTAIQPTGLMARSIDGSFGRATAVLNCTLMFGV
jgi:hypothetical protein